MLLAKAWCQCTREGPWLQQRVLCGVSQLQYPVVPNCQCYFVVADKFAVLSS